MRADRVRIGTALFANFAGQSWTAALGIVMVPFYVRYLGLESFALVGFYATLFAWMALLDLGLSATLGRQLARYRAGGVSLRDAAGLARSFETVFLAIAALVMFFVAMIAPWLAADWFQVGHLKQEVVIDSVRLMGLAAGIRFVAGLYRAGILGLDKHVWLNGQSALINSIRWVGVLPVIVLWPSVELFFIYQAATALLESLVLRWYLGRQLPADNACGLFSWELVRSHAGLSAGLAFTTAVWLLVTQGDKLLLSHILMLQDYGYFVLAVLVASAVSVAVLPLQQALQPSFTFLAARGNSGELSELYHLATQLSVAIVLPAGVIMAIWPDAVLYAWIGDRDTARAAAPTLVYYALGNVCLALLVPLYQLQVAFGRLRLHVMGNAFFVVILVPLIYWAATHWGGRGAALVWFCENALFIVLWVPLVHRFFGLRETRRWYMENILPPVLMATCAGFALYEVVPVDLNESRWNVLGYCLSAWAITALMVTASLRRVRERLLQVVLTKRDVDPA